MKWVLKVYPEPRAAVEARNLRRLAAAGLRVPQVLAQGSNWLRLGYLPGQNLCQLWEEAEAAGGDGRELLPPLLAWLKEYHALGLTGLTDLNWRNFILAEDGSLAVLDFEEEGRASLLEDLGQILAYAITYDPPFSKWKQTWLNWALPVTANYFSFSRSDIEIAYERELAKLVERRKKLGIRSEE
jgi:hypothetical protein